MFSCVSSLQQQNEVSDSETRVSHRLDPHRTEAQTLQEEEEGDDEECEHINGKVVKSSSDAHLSTSSGTRGTHCSSFNSAAYECV